MKEYKCSNCFYCDAGYFTHWCRFWNRMFLFKNGCTRETTIFDYDYDPDNIDIDLDTFDPNFGDDD